MTFMITRPRQRFVPMFDEMNRMMEDMWNLRSRVDDQSVWNPPVDIVESKDKILVKADMPGLDKDGFKISVEDNVLTIQGEKKMEYEEGDKEHNYHRVERVYGTFSRSFTLPVTVDTGKVTAKYRNGVLEVSLPKTEQSKPKQIAVNME